MSEDRVKAHLFLYGLLPLLEELVVGDAAARSAVSGLRGVIQLGAPRGLVVQVRFADGEVSVMEQGRLTPDVSVYFPTCRFLNNLFEKRGLVLPIPLKGLWRVRLLFGFKRLADRLEQYLGPEAERLDRVEARQLLATLLLFASLRGAAQVAEADEALRELAKSIPDGTLHMEIRDGPSGYLTKRGARFTVHRGHPQSSTTRLAFKDHDVALAMLTGRLDFMAAIPLGDIELDGSLVMADKLTQLMTRAEEYLA